MWKSWSAAYFKEVWYSTDQWDHRGYVGEEVSHDPAGLSWVMCPGRSGQGRAGRSAASAVPVRDTEDCGSAPGPVTSLQEHSETNTNVEPCKIWSLRILCLCILSQKKKKTNSEINFRAFDYTFWAFHIKNKHCHIV